MCQLLLLAGHCESAAKLSLASQARALPCLHAALWQPSAVPAPVLQKVRGCPTADPHLNLSVDCRRRCSARRHACACAMQEADVKYSYLWNCRGVWDQATRIVLATDNDGPGHALAEELARRLGAAAWCRTAQPGCLCMCTYYSSCA